jgi:uncharacterized membrane protein YfcA
MSSWRSIAGLAGNLALVQYLPAAIGPCAVAAVAGGLLGSEIGSRHLGSQKLRRLLAIVLFMASAKLILV